MFPLNLPLQLLLVVIQYNAMFTTMYNYMLFGLISWQWTKGETHRDIYATVSLSV